MTEIRKPIPRDVARLLLVSGLWGSSFLCNEIALNDFSPLAITAWRVIIATVLVFLMCRWYRLETFWDRRSIAYFSGIGLLNSAIPFTLIGWGQQTVDPATTSILIAASPFVTLVLSHVLTRDDRFTVQKLCGLLVGFLGVVVLLWRQVVVDDSGVRGMLAILVAAGCYSMSALLIRRVGPMPSLSLVAGTLACSSAVLLPLLLWRHPPWEQSVGTSSLLAVAFLAIGPTAWAYVLRTRIVQLNGAVFMSNAGYLIPVFAVLWAWLFLGNTLSGHTTVAMLLVFTGIAIGQSRNLAK